ncbi:MAG: hypothetical protein GY838_02565 [bacterium]|nr:hypothetical protein [bacterium]
MPTISVITGPVRFHAVFPDWHAPQPLCWFFTEQLLEARAASAWPTNGNRPDEDVNVYLGNLLEEFVTGHRITVPGAAPLERPPAKDGSRRTRAAYYRAAADHRLLALGLYDRGDLVRRRRTPWGRTADETRRYDLETGRRCYDLAANLLSGRGGAWAGLAPVLGKLADGFDDYVQVLAVLARRKFGLGAVLDQAQLAGLMRNPAVAASTATMDDLLDLMNTWRATPDPELADRIDTTARRLGVDPACLGLAAEG